MALNTSMPVIAPRVYLGLRTDIESNAHYISDSEIVYPAGTVLIVHNHQQKKQKYIRLQDKNNPIKSMVLSPNRRWLALNELGSKEDPKPIITIYDMTINKRRKILTVPFEKHTAKEFVCLDFTYDSKFLIAVTGEPDWHMYFYYWDKGKLDSHAPARNPEGYGTVTGIYCNPTDNTLIVITGPQTFRIMNVLESAWNQWGWCKAENLNITACMWLTTDRIMFGTDDGKIMMVENGEIRLNCIFRAGDVVEMFLKKVEAAAETDQAEDEEETASKQGSQIGTEEQEERYPVTKFVVFPKGFTFCYGPGYVHMFEKESPHLWKKRNIFRISRRSYKHAREYPVFSHLDEIQHITVDPSQETLLITTLRKQLYTVKMFGVHMSQDPEIPFVELGPSMHYGPITSLSMCSWKPIFMTVGEDMSIRLWNYLTEELEMIKIYPEEIFCVSLHPTGLFTLIGFPDKLRFMVVLIDDFELMREFPIRNCKQAKFSTNGHFFAAVNGQVIQVFSSVSFANVYNLKGHNGKVQGLSWSRNDLILVSCGDEGAVYEWNMNSGQRVGEVILKKIRFSACMTNSNGKTTYTASMDGELKEIGGNTVRKSLPLLGVPLTNIVLSRSDTMLFITGGDGTVTATQLPLLDKVIYNQFNMHDKKVMRIALSYDDQTLVSVGEDASICIWNLTNPEGRAIALDRGFTYSKEILISKKDLLEKINSISLLSTRMSELETEHNYQKRQAESSQAEKLKEVHEGYCSAIEELKEKNELMENDHAHEIGMIQQDINKMRAGHESTLQELEAEFNIRLISEYDRYQGLEDKNARMRNEFEERLRELAEDKRQALRKLNAMYEAKLEDKEYIIQELQEKLDLEKSEHTITVKEIEDDVDHEILEIRATYETQVEEEKAANVRVKGETGLMKKKLISATKEIEEFKHSISQLKAEHKQFQKVIGNLEKEVTDLKKDTAERDLTIQDKEKRIYQLKRKKQELEKYKFVLNFKIAELKNLIEPLVRAIKEGKERILELEVALETLLRKKAYREMIIVQTEEKVRLAKKDYLAANQRNLWFKNVLRQIKIDLHDMTNNFQEPAKLKLAVKTLFQKYTEDRDFLRSRIADEAAITEFNRQREFLENEVATAKAALDKAVNAARADIHKIMDENCTLLIEISGLRAELKSTRARCSHLESILGLSARYTPPAEARAKLNNITEDREKLDEKFKEKIEEKEVVISALREEKARLLEKVRGPEDIKVMKSQSIRLGLFSKSSMGMADGDGASQLPAASMTQGDGAQAPEPEHE